MQIRKTIIGVLVAATAVWGWQGLMGTLGWTDAEKGVIARRVFTDDGFQVLPGTYELKSAVKQAWSARPAADRVGLVKELGAAAKAFVAAPGFQAQYDEWIKQRYSAVNHGIKLNDQADMQKMMEPGGADQMMSQAMAQMAQSFLKMPPATVAMMIPQDIENHKGARDAKGKQLYAKALEVQNLLKTNPAEGVKQYALMKSIEMGGPTTLAGIESGAAAGANSQAEQKKKQEQRSYNEHLLKPTLKKKLGEFVALARTVDFAAQTKTVGTRIVFVSPEHERKSRAWKQLYRLGREPVAAAAAFAEQWMREL